jgi:hypothetical protein
MERKDSLPGNILIINKEFLVQGRFSDLPETNLKYMHEERVSLVQTGNHGRLNKSTFPNNQIIVCAFHS